MSRKFPKLPRKLGKTNYQYLFIVLGVLLLGLVALVLFSGKRFGEPFFNQTKYNVEFVHMDGCPHCVTFKPIWETVMKDADLNKLAFVDYEQSKNPDRVKKFGFNSFPTIVVILNDGDKIVAHYKGDRTVEDFKAFLMNYQKLS